MSEYTAEDFANARFAEHENGRAAMRPQPGRLWHLGSVHMGDDGMALDGWRPVVEADHPARPLAGYRAQVKELREENDRLERILQAPPSLKDLEVAWENADEATEETPIREGDVVIVRRHGGGFTVEPADRILSGQTHGRERILSRAPQPPPWQALADVLAVEMPGIEDEPRIEALAKALYCEHDVRVTDGDEA